MTALVEGSSAISVTKNKERLCVEEFINRCAFFNTFEKYYYDYHHWRFEGRKDIPFLWDAVRFSHKIFAINYLIENSSADAIIWLDADIVTHKDIPLNFLMDDLNLRSGFSFLGRDFLKSVQGGLDYPECGFMVFHPKTEGFKYFWRLMVYYYFEYGIFDLFEWHDSFVFKHVLSLTRRDYPNFGFDICSLGLLEVSDPSHVFVASRLGEFMDHRKGGRKSLEFSPEYIERSQAGLDELSGQ